MPSTFPTLDAFATNRTDATTSATTHAADHNNANDALNKFEADYLTNGARKNVAAGGGDFVGRLMAKLQTFLGRVSNPTNVWSTNVVEIDARTTVQGHPDGGWAAGTGCLYLLPNADGTAAMTMRLDTTVAGVGMLFSHADGAHQFRFQPGGGLNPMIWEAETSTGTMRAEFEIPAGAVAGTALAQFNSNMRVVGHLIVGNHFQEIGGIRHGSATWDPASIADDAHSASVDVTVTGAVVGDPAFAAFSSIAAAGWEVHATVRAADTVSVHLVNRTGSPVDLGSGTVKAVVVQPV